MALAAAGYRLSRGHGGHERAFDVVRYIVQAERIEDLCDYFDTCRRKRNDIDYDFADVITDTELAEILGQVSEYRELVEKWIIETHPDLTAG